MLKIEDIKNRNCYLLDFSYHLYRSYYSLMSLSITLPSGVVKPSGHIFGLVNTVLKVREADPEGLIFLAIDGYPEDRRQLAKDNGVEYKADRPKLQYSIHQDTSLICDLIYHIPGVYTLENDSVEADDLMFAMAKKLDKSNNVYIYTTDNDLLQTLDSNVSIIKKWNSLNDPELVTLTSYYEDEKLTKKFAGTHPNKLPFYRALCGDSSDNIKGIHRLPRVVAGLIANNINSPEEYKNVVEKFSHCCTKSQIKYLYEIERQADRIIGNYNIMRLYDTVEFEIVREPKPIKEVLEVYQLTKYTDWLKQHKISII